MHLHFFAAICVLVTSASAFTWSFTKPVGNTVYKAGATAQLEWKTDQKGGVDGKLTDQLHIQLLNSGGFVATVATGVDPKKNSLAWTIPANMITSNQYQLRMGIDDTDWSYSSRFEIKGVDGTVVPTGAPPPPGVASTVLGNASMPLATRNASALLPSMNISASGMMITPTSMLLHPTSLNASLSMPTASQTAAKSTAGHICIGDSLVVIITLSLFSRYFLM
ncbi:uncharacterized protein VTP21DRAFT_108 [Calcarisporiella thermophila]|uniref:uncharacterized protein n=1 Tax=Calcarisporiella thermophila TaxID=911321 RepID=UPI0037442EFC